MKKNLGIFGLLIVIVVVAAFKNPNFLSAGNIYINLRWLGLYGIMSIGVAFVIITGGIDLSIGSVIGLIGCLLPIWLAVSFGSFREEPNTFRVTAIEQAESESPILRLDEEGEYISAGDRLSLPADSANAERPRVRIAAVEVIDGATVVTLDGPLAAGALSVDERVGHQIPVGWKVTGWVVLILLFSAALGLVHGLLITKLGLQPFIVTLCGLMIYRGLAREVAEDQTEGFGDRFGDLLQLSDGDVFGLPMPFVIMVVIAVLAGVFLNYTIWGRYLLALGKNETAARLSGINTDRMIILAYVICSLLAGISGILFAFYLKSIQPSNQGNFYELYAIAAAVLGACSLRGGEGSIVGVVIATAIIRVLFNVIGLEGDKSRMELTVIGTVVLIGVIVDELVKRFAAQYRARRQAAAASSG